MKEPIDTPGHKAASAALLGMALPQHYLERLREMEEQTYYKKVAESFGALGVAATDAGLMFREFRQPIIISALQKMEFQSIPQIRISKHRQARQQRFRARHKS